MTDEASENRAFRELEDHNPAVAKAFRAFRDHATALDSQKHIDLSSPTEETTLAAPSEIPPELGYRPSTILMRVIGLVLLIGGLVAFGLSVGPSVIPFLQQHWKNILLPTGGACLGAGVVLLVSRLGTAPLLGVDPPNENSDDPLQELKDLAERTSSRLRAAYRFQLSTVVTVGAIFVGLIVWSMVMVSQERILYATVFGSGGVAMAILTQWKWQPFDRIDQARRLADNADTLATGLRLRMKTISEIEDPTKRSEAQWNAVSEYLARSR